MLNSTSAQARMTAAQPRPTRLLVVGGSERNRCPTTGLLEPRGYDVDRVAALEDAGPLSAFEVVVFKPRQAQAEVVIDLCRELREDDDAGPALVVLNPGEDGAYAIRALEAGADDCVAFPHNPREVLARIRALVRRRERSRTRYGGRHFVFDGLFLDARSRRIQAADGRVVDLTHGQYRLLAALLSRPGEVVSREALVGHVLGADSESFDRAIDVHVSRLKKRLAQVSDAALISSYRGIGYRIAVRTVMQ